MELAKRKKIRMENFDYSSSGAYFITICSKNREPLFWKNEELKGVGANCVRQPLLSEIGNLVSEEIATLDRTYQNVTVDKYCIMPDHIHMIIFIFSDSDGRTQFAPTLSRVIKQFKGSVSKKVGRSIWQKSFADRVIRNELGYRAAWNYIEANPNVWMEDSI